MVAERELMVEREGFGVRGLLLLAAPVVALVFVGLVVARSWEALPEGEIGYRDGDGEAWVNARGEAAKAPQAWPRAPVIAPVFSAELGVEQFTSPDGEVVAFIKTTDEGAWLISRLMVKEGSRVTEVAQLGGGDWPALVAGGKGGARSRGGVPLVVAWSPDGQKLAWGSVTNAPYNLQIADRGTWAPRSLPLVGGYVGELAWSPNGRYLAISTYAADRTDHTILMLDTVEDGVPRQVAKGCVMVWSPDSGHLALHGEPKTQPGLWVVSVEGKARRVIDRTGVAPFAWVAE